MRKLSWLLLFLVLFTSCKNNGKKISGQNIPSADLIKLLGSFVGVFGENKMTLLITKAEKGIIEGRTIVAGNDRPFSGTVEEDDGVYSIAAKEPGDDANDGAFLFKIQSSAPDIVEGVWQPFDNNKKAKEYKLLRKEFAYRVDVGDYPEGSQRELKPEDVENMMKSDLEQMRNEIFARHGYCFKKKNMRDMFEFQDWYVPNNTDIRSSLTTIEKKNIELIKRYEKYAEDYGDEFGR